MCGRRLLPKVQKYSGVVLASIVEMRKAQVPLARIMGDRPLIASLRSLEAGGPNTSDLKAIGAFGKKSGTGAKTSALIDREAPVNDTTIKLLPIQTNSGWTLAFGSKKSQAG